jgi:hypothetical protein
VLVAVGASFVLLSRRSSSFAVAGGAFGHRLAWLVGRPACLSVCLPARLPVGLLASSRRRGPIECLCAPSVFVVAPAASSAAAGPRDNGWQFCKKLSFALLASRRRFPFAGRSPADQRRAGRADLQNSPCKMAPMEKCLLILIVVIVVMALGLLGRLAVLVLVLVVVVGGAAAARRRPLGFASARI